MTALLLAIALLTAKGTDAEKVPAETAPGPADVAATDPGTTDRGTSASSPGSTVLAPLAPARPELPARDRCHRYPGVRVEICDGPRRVPEPTPEAAERAARLGLGTHAAADRLSLSEPLPEWVAEVPTDELHDDLLWPVANGLLARRFGVGRIHAESSGTHPGVDVVAAEGTLLRAVRDGLVAYADNGVRGMGNSLWLVHADGSVSIYAHCRALRVAAGELVRRGQVVGELGATGLTFRAHLHYEWRVRGQPRDPMPRFVERPTWRMRLEDDGEVTWLAPPPNSHALDDGRDGDGGEDEAVRDAPSPQRSETPRAACPLPAGLSGRRGRARPPRGPASRERRRRPPGSPARRSRSDLRRCPRGREARR